jgi:hypothetical protein
MATKKANGDAAIRSDRNKALVNALYEPFPEEKIKTRDGRAGQKWKYVESAELINRLNQVLGLTWSMIEKQSEFIPPSNPTHVVKRVQIIVPDPDNPSRDVVREGWGSHPLFDNRGRPYDPGDVMKSAQSKAFSKAVSSFGVALHLWGVDGEAVHEGVPEDYMPPWQGPDQFSQVPDVTVVNPGPHNQQPNFPSAQPMVAPPQMSNPMAPPQAAPQGPPMGGQMPFPQMGNPAFDIGITSGPGTPAVAQVGLQTQPQPGGGPTVVQDFQLSAISGAAASRGMQNPMQLVSQALGPEVSNIQDVGMLSFDQALRVLDYIRSTQNNSF